MFRQVQGIPEFGESVRTVGYSEVATLPEDTWLKRVGIEDGLLDSVNRCFLVGPEE